VKIESDANEVVNSWRAVIKNKRRMVYTFGERADIRLNAIKGQIYQRRIPLDTWEIREGYHRGQGQYEYRSDWRPISVGEPWGGKDITAFFRRSIDVPAEFDGESVALRFYIGGDSLLSVNGVPYQGMDPFRNEVLLAAARGGDRLDIAVEAFVNWHTGEADNKIFHQAELAVIDRPVYDAYWDFWCAFKVLAIEDLNPELRQYLEYHLWEAMKPVPPKVDDAGVFRAKLLAAQQQLRSTVYAATCFKSPGLIHLVGHSHLDLVFMWTYREYVRKVGRTHATMLRLMEQYPEFRFCQSMANTYAEMKAHFPAIFEQVKRRVAEGRWDVIGAMWVEPDCNLISGESFVRQILHGQAFFQRELGVQSQTCWQPDVFGMTASLPQILARSGVTSVMTTKMAVWNDTNPWTHNAFWWEGIDGTRVFTFVPSTHFIGMVDPDHLHDHWQNFSAKETLGESLYCYGWGDGGGGVDIEMLESARRYADFMGLPRLKFSGAEEALASIAARAPQVDLPVWRDELYLEAHRGTFTNKGLLKKYNRRLELLYREAEILATWAGLEGTPYPADALHRGWQALLTTQFHDSLPGTHITEVFHDLVAELARIETLGQQIRLDATRALLSGLDGSSVRPEAITIFNSFLHLRSDSLCLPETVMGNAVLFDEAGQPLPHQHVTGLDHQPGLLTQLPAIPSVGYRVFHLAQSAAEGARPTSTVQAAEGLLENEFLRARFNAEGELVSLYDKEQAREVLVDGQMGNHFQLFEDMPGKYDAWDIVASFADHEIVLPHAETMTVDETGPVRASLRLEKPFFNSRITQRISLYAGAHQLVFETHVHWQERQKLLKVGFPVDVNASYATYDIAFGNLRRPVHRNTSYDAAKFEVPAHQWMDISDGGYGVSLLNDCKYGHEAHGQLIRLTLLKGSVYPDPEADLGDHDFTYAFYPHAGSWEAAQTLQHALNLNSPLAWSLGNPADSQPTQHSFLACTAPNLSLEAVKRAEDGQHIILRLVERHNCHTRATLVFDRPVVEAWSCDLMEKIETRLNPVGHELPVVLKSYEILTLRVALGAG
jgi:alpha-mannosidase